MKYIYILILSSCLFCQHKADFTAITTGGTLEYPKVFASADGGFIITCTQTTGDIFLKRFSADQTPLNDTFEARSAPVGLVGSKTDVIQLADGTFVVAFAESAGNFDIKIKTFNSNLEPNGTEYTILNVTTGEQEAPDMQPLPDGGFVMVFEGENISGGNGKDIGLKIFNSDLEYDQAVLVASTNNNGDQISPQVCVLSDGRYIVVW